MRPPIAYLGRGGTRSPSEQSHMGDLAKGGGFRPADPTRTHATRSRVRCAIGWCGGPLGGVTSCRSSTALRELSHWPSLRWWASSRPRWAAARRATRLRSASTRAAMGTSFAGPATLGMMKRFRLSIIAAGQDLTEGSDVALVCLLHGPQVGGALFLEDHDRRVAEPDQHQVQRRAVRHDRCRR